MLLGETSTMWTPSASNAPRTACTFGQRVSNCSRFSASQTAMSRPGNPARYQDKLLRNPIRTGGPQSSSRSPGDCRRNRAIEEPRIRTRSRWRVLSTVETRQARDNTARRPGELSPRTGRVSRCIRQRTRYRERRNPAAGRGSIACAPRRFGLSVQVCHRRHS